MALVVEEVIRCGSCGQHDTLVPLNADTRHVTWPNGDVYEVGWSRCLVCGAKDLIKRDFDARHEKDKHVENQYMEGDGRQIHVRLVSRGGGTGG